MLVLATWTLVACFRLHVKEEAADYLQPDTIRNLVKKYSQFINFPIYLWASRTETVEEPDADADADDKADADDDAQVPRSHSPSPASAALVQQCVIV